MHYSKIAIPTVVIFGATILNSAAQDFVSPPDSAFLDNVASSSEVSLGRMEYISLLKTTGTGPVTRPAADTKSFWSKKRVTLSYSYSRVDSKLADNAVTDGHSFQPEFYLESAGGFSMNFGLGYSRSDKELPPTDSAETDSYTGSFTAGQDILQLFSSTKDSKSKLLFNLTTIAGQSLSTRSGVAAGDTDADSLTLAPNFVYARPLGARAVAIIVPTYAHQWRETRRSPTPASYTFGSLFTLQGRTDITLSEDKKWGAVLTATWKHDIDQKVPAGGTKNLNDWAEFGATLVWRFNPAAAARLGYGFEAFHPDFEGHKVSARLELSF